MFGANETLTFPAFLRLVAKGQEDANAWPDGGGRGMVGGWGVQGSAAVPVLAVAFITPPSPENLGPPLGCPLRIPFVRVRGEA